MTYIVIVKIIKLKTYRIDNMFVMGLSLLKYEVLAGFVFKVSNNDEYDEDEE
ncbi:hypothetical protein DKAM_1232 [Desulfurococcus amylolyticus 1221n]|uniref:Uncharacterized protein n=1 Tax=Desulfurococcus amylolyticus (strain DSM 18924 / JCM 16383 / VKM B-2413 / 1221n) TaxID=490899 RepID=B8D627_DESA1|nr:hypothetical protein DKAM_1232 [Desulfurococcus amylolyticus 1221n]